MDGEVLPPLAQPGLSTRIIAESPEMQWSEDRKTSPRVNRADSGLYSSQEATDFRRAD